MKVLVCGGRNYADKMRVFTELNNLRPDIVVHGNARGADALADEWANDQGVAVRRYPAKWDVYGKWAGPIRNELMLEAECEGLDLVLAFPGGAGTLDMIRRARLKNIPVKIISE